eukprot:COSAG03_NODE_1049_length_4950_cov_49.608534_1_plen_61_part_00
MPVRIMSVVRYTEVRAISREGAVRASSAQIPLAHLLRASARAAAVVRGKILADTSTHAGA